MNAGRVPVTDRGVLMPLPPTTYVSTKEAARRLGVHHTTVVALLHADELSGYPQTTRISGRVHAWKIAEPSIAAYIRRQQLKVPA